MAEPFVGEQHPFAAAEMANNRMQRKAIIPSIPTAWWVTAIIFFLIAFMSIDRAPKRLPVQASKQPDTKQSTLMQAWSTRWATNTTAKRVERKILSLHPRIELEENFLSDDAVAKLLVLHHDDSSGRHELLPLQHFNWGGSLASAQYS